jgi:hypothetical protein
VAAGFVESLKKAICESLHHVAANTNVLFREGRWQRRIKKLECVPTEPAPDQNFRLQDAKPPCPFGVVIGNCPKCLVRFLKGAGQVSLLKFLPRVLVPNFRLGAETPTAIRHTAKCAQQNQTYQGKVVPFPPAPGPFTYAVVAEPISKRSIVTSRS